MDCSNFHELMWENDLPDEFFEHLEACQECKKEYELVKKMRDSLASTEDMTGRIMAEAKKEKRRHTLALISKYAAVFVCVLAIGIFARLAIDSGFNRKNDSNMFDFGYAAESEEIKSESNYSTDGGSSNGVLFDRYDEPMEEAPEADCEWSEPEAPVATDDEAPMETAGGTTAPSSSQSLKEAQKVLDVDLYMLLNEYKDMHGLSQHTADIIVTGGDINGAADVLYEIGAEVVDFHIEISGDFYFEAQMLLERAGFEISLCSSSETIGKTLVYFEEFLN